MTAAPPNPWGSCFDAAAHLFLGCDDLSNPRMCHGIGIANKPGEEGTPIAHAWIEFDHPEHGRVAIDPIWLLAQRAVRYRKTLQVGYVVSYGRAEFLRLWVDHNFPGPWDERVKALTLEGKVAAKGNAA